MINKSGINFLSFKMILFVYSPLLNFLLNAVFVITVKSHNPANENAISYHYSVGPISEPSIPLIEGSLHCRKASKKYHIEQPCSSCPVETILDLVLFGVFNNTIDLFEILLCEKRVLKK